MGTRQAASHQACAIDQPYDLDRVGWYGQSNEQRGYEVDSTLEPSFTALRIGIWSSHQLPLYHYLGRLDGYPVATASLLLSEGIAGIYDVTTVPSARKRGVGTAMLLHLLHMAQQQGSLHAWLQPSEMAYSLYEQLGFRVCGACSIYG